MKKLGVIFGGKSTENEVSEQSAKSVLANLDKTKYEIYPIYINRDGVWFEYENMKQIENIIEYLRKLDVVFPVLHGLYGEDGTIQGMLKLFDIPYIGCGVLASSVGMDKGYTKVVLEKAKINQVEYLYLKKYKENEDFIYIDEELNEINLSLEEVINLTIKKLNFPVFVKPSNSGSSVGVTKATNTEELRKSIVKQ